MCDVYIYIKSLDRSTFSLYIPFVCSVYVRRSGHSVCSRSIDAPLRLLLEDYCLAHITAEADCLKIDRLGSFYIIAAAALGLAYNILQFIIHHE